MDSGLADFVVRIADREREAATYLGRGGDPGAKAAARRVIDAAARVRQALTATDGAPAPESLLALGLDVGEATAAFQAERTRADAQRQRAKRRRSRKGGAAWLVSQLRAAGADLERVLAYLAQHGQARVAEVGLTLDRRAEDRVRVTGQDRIGYRYGGRRRSVTVRRLREIARAKP